MTPVSGNLLTGALYIDLIRNPDLPLQRIDFDTKPYATIPSVASELDSITGSVQDLTDKILSLPIERLIGSATRVLDDLHRGLGAVLRGEGRRPRAARGGAGRRGAGEDRVGASQLAPARQVRSS